MESNVPTEQEPGDIFRRDIDRAFSSTSTAASVLISDLANRKIVNRARFVQFYENFAFLYFNTFFLKQLYEPESELVEAIQKWLHSPYKDQDFNRVREGVNLFRLWAQALDARGIHNLE
jgi:hypothetical protein